MAGTRPTDALEQRAGDHLLVRRFRLRVQAGPSAGVVYQSTGSRVAIGTHRSNELVLEDRTMSRFHCEIRLVDGRPQVRDLGSRNGTWIDGVGVESGYLADRSELACGQTKLRFEIGDDEVRVPLSASARFGLVVGRSPAMREVFDVLERVAPTDATVLLYGETGSGKDLSAESIHRASPRRERPYVAVDCGALPGQLLESELFGHERGAFTGADRARPGAFEVADGGTLFLDEIGELPLDLQPKLLRALGSGQIQRVGGTPRRVDVRIVAATNRDLKREVNHRRFRSDLYYRLAVVEVRLPPLRERGADMPLLVEAILADLGAAGRREAAALLSPGVLAELARHQWPGNVRELRNHIERVLAAGAPPLPADGEAGGLMVSVPLERDLPFHTARDRCLAAFERAYLEELLRRHDNNASQAARAAGLARSQLYVVLGRRGLR